MPQEVIPFYQDSTRWGPDWYKMLQQRPERVSVISEGDSWFAYPGEWLPFSPPINVAAQIDKLSRNSLNRFRMESNGDILLKMLSTSGLQRLKRYLKGPIERGLSPVDFVMISGTGNDIAGKGHPEFDLGDFASFLNKYQSGFNVDACINKPAFDKAFSRFESRLNALVKMRDTYTPTTWLVFHCYDYAFPTGIGASFAGGLVESNAWLKPYMVKREIPKNLHRDIVKYLINRIAELYDGIAKTHGNILFVDTRKTLLHKSQWLNELHPTEKSFEKIARKIYVEMRKVNPKLKSL